MDLLSAQAVRRQRPAAITATAPRVTNGKVLPDSGTPDGALLGEEGDTVGAAAVALVVLGSKERAVEENTSVEGEYELVACNASAGLLMYQVSFPVSAKLVSVNR